MCLSGVPGGSDGKESPYSAGDLGSIPGLGRSPGGGNGNTLQYSCLENSMQGGAWRATVHGIPKSRTWLSDFLFFFFFFKCVSVNKSNKTEMETLSHLKNHPQSKTLFPKMFFYIKHNFLSTKSEKKKTKTKKNNTGLQSLGVQTIVWWGWGFKIFYP